MRYKEIITETNGELNRLVDLAKRCSTYDEFIRKTDGMDVLYRGHFDDSVGNNAFMTDYVGHAAEYVDETGKIDGFLVDWSDVMWIKNAEFEQIRLECQRLTKSDYAAIYRDALADGRLSNSMPRRGSVIAKVQKVIDGDVPFDSFSDDPTIMDLVVPLLQHYALKRGKNIISFVGGDYGGSQNEFVVHDVSKLVNLRDLFARVHQNPNE